MSFIAVMLMSFMLNAGFDFDNPSSLSFTQADIPQPAFKNGIKTDVKDVTLMVFMNAKNRLSGVFNLNNWAAKDIDEMKRVGSTDRVNVIVEVGEKGKGSKRIRVVKDGEEVLMEDKNADMGSYKRVVDFVRWTKSTFPAKRYILVLWSDGSGWIDPKKFMSSQSGRIITSKGMLYDYDTNNYVRTRQMSEMFREIEWVDVVIFNICMMQMAEVAYEIKDYTSLIIGSEEAMSTYGFDYEEIIKFLDLNPYFSKKQIADFLTNWYKEFYGSLALSGGFTLSAVEANELKNLPQYLNYFVLNVMNNKEEEAVRYAIEKVIRFKLSLDPKNDKEKKMAPYVDLYDFVRLVEEKAKTEETKRAASLLMNFIKSKLVISSVGLNEDTTNGYDYSVVGGVAINMTMKIKPVPPQLDSILETKYTDLSLSKDSYWDEFVSWATKIWNENYIIDDLLLHI